MPFLVLANPVLVPPGSPPSLWGPTAFTLFFFSLPSLPIFHTNLFLPRLLQSPRAPADTPGLVAPQPRPKWSCFQLRANLAWEMPPHPPPPHELVMTQEGSPDESVSTPVR